MSIEYLLSERTYDSYLDLLTIALFDLKKGNDSVIILFNDFFMMISEAKFYTNTKTGQIYREITVLKATHSYRIGKEVIGVGCDDADKFYFIGLKDYKLLLKKDVFFPFFFWIIRVKEDKTFKVDDTILFSYSQIFENLASPKQKIGAGMVLKRCDIGHSLKPFEINTLISKWMKQMNNTRTHS